MRYGLDASRKRIDAKATKVTSIGKVHQLMDRLSPMALATNLQVGCTKMALGVNEQRFR